WAGVPSNTPSSVKLNPAGKSARTQIFPYVLVRVSSKYSPTRPTKIFSPVIRGASGGARTKIVNGNAGPGPYSFTAYTFSSILPASNGIPRSAFSATI